MHVRTKVHSDRVQFVQTKVAAIEGHELVEEESTVTACDHHEQYHRVHLQLLRVVDDVSKPKVDQ